MTSLLQSKPLPKIYQSRALNITNGSDAESLAAAMILLAIRAEISWGSREEDGRKIDLFLSCDHPWFDKERLIILSQVKSGLTYGEVLKDGGFKLKREAYQHAQRTTHSILIIWVDRDLNEVFWAYVHPHSKKTSHNYGIHHRLTPATYFDLARCVSKDLNIKSDGKGITIRKRNSNFKIRRQNVLKNYRSLKKIFCPSLGDIEVTRLAWRHMFRKGRSLNHKITSLDTIPYIKKILEDKPTEHAITAIKEWKHKKFYYRKTEHLLKYSDVKLYKELKLQNITVLFRIIEEIRYPLNWVQTAMLTQQVERKLVFKTVYYKE